MVVLKKPLRGIFLDVFCVVLKLWTRRIRELEDELLRQFRSAEKAQLAAEKAQAAEAAKLAAEAAAKAAEAMRGL
jgi:hypothetical protein